MSFHAEIVDFGKYVVWEVVEENEMVVFRSEYFLRIKIIVLPQFLSFHTWKCNPSLNSQP